MRKGFVPIVFAVAICLTGRPAIASPIFYSAATASVADNNTGLSDYSSTNTVLYGVASTGQKTANIGGASALAYVDNGALGAYATTTSAGGTEFINAFGQAVFSDTLVLSSTELSAGTLATWNYSLDFDRSVSGPGTGLYGCTIATANLDVYLSTDGSTLGSLRMVDSDGCQSDGSIASGSFQAAVGSEIAINYALYAGAGTRLGATATADAAHTLLFFLDPTNPSNSYSTASGLSYLSPAVNPTPVPEPASLFLLGTGMAGIAAKIRKRRKQVQ